MEGKIIKIKGKKINLDKLSNEEIKELYEKLNKREKIVDKKIAAYEKTHKAKEER